MGSLHKILWLLPLASNIAHADCLNAISNVAFTSSLAQAQSAYGDLDIEGFRTAMVQIRGDLPCLAEELPPHLAAELHRFEGLLAFTDRRSDRSTSAFAAARRIEPHYHFLDSFVPPGNPVLGDYTALNPDDGKDQVLAEPAEGRIVLDGRSSLQRPESFPSVFQLVTDSGEVRSTSYLWPEDATPAYAVRAQTVSNVQNPNSNAVAALHTGPNRGLLTTAGVGLIASATLYGGAFVVHRRYTDLDTAPERLDGLRTTNNLLVLSSGAVAATALTLGTSAFLVARF